MRRTGWLVMVGVGAVISALVLVLAKHVFAIPKTLFLVIAGVVCFLLVISAAMAAAKMSTREVIDYLTRRGPGGRSTGHGNGSEPHGPSDSDSPRRQSPADFELAAEGSVAMSEMRAPAPMPHSSAQQRKTA